MASLELCIDHWDRPCVQLDVQDTYSRVIDELDPVIVWSGRLPDVAPHKTLTMTLRMIEFSDQPKLMTLHSIVCSGLYEPLPSIP